VPLVVAFARLRAHPGRALLVVVGVAAAQALLVGVLGGSAIARDRAVQNAVGELPLNQRSFRVDAFGLPNGKTYAQVDRFVRSTLAPLSSAQPLRATFFRTLSVDNELVQLAAIDDLGSLVRLRSGRLPRSCTPAACEVLQIGSQGAASLDEAGIHLRRVGIADLPSRALLGTALEPGQGQTAVVLLASGALAFDRLPVFKPFYRTYSWIDPIAPRHLHVWQISGILDGETQAQARLYSASVDAYTLSGPDQALVDARGEGRVAARRLVLVGGEVSALLLGFALVAAIGLRRGLADERRRLLQRGASRTQAWLAVCAEVGGMTVAGTVLGVAAGVLAVELVAGAAGLPGGDLLAHSLWALVPVGVVLLAWLAATVAVVVAASVPESQGRRRRVRALDVAAVGAVVAIGIGLSRGALDAQALSSGSNGTLLLLLPGLICFVAAVLAARLLGPLMRLAERSARRGPIALRLALLALARAPSRTIATAAFLLVALALAFFASSYRSTLAAGARDEAAFQVPLDFALTEGQRLVLPLQASSLAGYRALAPGTEPYPVLRRSAEIPGLGAGVASPTVLGLPAAAFSRLHWRSDFASVGAAELGRRVGADGPASLRGVAVPAGATEVSTRVRIRGVPVRLELVVQGENGQVEPVQLGQRFAGTYRLTARLPAGTRQVVALGVELATSQQFVYLHRAAEGATIRTPTGSIDAGPLMANGRPLGDWRGWISRSAETVRGGRSLHVDYSFAQVETVVVRRPQATDGKPLRVVVSPNVARTAGPGGSLTLDFQTVEVPATIVGVAKRFPDSQSADEGFVVADESRLATALDADSPGAGTPDELWLATPSPSRVAAGLAQPPFSSLVTASRADIERSLRDDPLSRGITITLAAAALLTLVLAAVGFWVALTSELRDERGELFDLEAQGVAPDTLRRQFRLRATALVALGALGGIALGVLLSLLVVAVVRVSASSAAPEPPLRFEPSWLTASVGLAALLVALAAVVETTTRTAFRGSLR
jgi:hypothetical protein